MFDCEGPKAKKDDVVESVEKSVEKWNQKLNVEIQQCTCKEDFCNSPAGHDRKSKYTTNLANSLTEVTLPNVKYVLLLYYLSIILQMNGN